MPTAPSCPIPNKFHSLLPHKKSFHNHQVDCLYVLPNLYMRFYVFSSVLPNLYKRLYVRLSVLLNLYVRLSVLPSLSVLPNLYVRFVIFPNMYVRPHVHFFAPGPYML